MKKIIFWIFVILICVNSVLALEIETDKFSYTENDVIKISLSEKSKVEYNNIVKKGKYVEFKAVKNDNKIIVNDDYEKLIYVSEEEFSDNIFNIGIFSFVNLFVLKIMKKFM